MFRTWVTSFIHCERLPPSRHPPKPTDPTPHSGPNLRWSRSWLRKSSRPVASYFLFSSYSHILIFSYPHISYPHILKSSRLVSSYLLFSSSHPLLPRSQTQDFLTASVTFRFTKPFIYMKYIYITDRGNIVKCKM